MSGNSSDETSQWLPLYALASHFAGDFPLQSNHMARRKFDNPVVRLAHVAVYTATFVPMVTCTDWSRRQSAAFLATLAVTHYAIDSRRWAENFDGFPTRALWFDQSFHLIALAVCVGVAERV